MEETSSNGCNAMDEELARKLLREDKPNLSPPHPREDTSKREEGQGPEPPAQPYTLKARDPSQLPGLANDSSPGNPMMIDAAWLSSMKEVYGKDAEIDAIVAQNIMMVRQVTADDNLPPPDALQYDGNHPSVDRGGQLHHYTLFPPCHTYQPSEKHHPQELYMSPSEGMENHPSPHPKEMSLLEKENFILDTSHLTANRLSQNRFPLENRHEKYFTTNPSVVGSDRYQPRDYSCDGEVSHGRISSEHEVLVVQFENCHITSGSSKSGLPVSPQPDANTNTRLSATEKSNSNFSSNSR